MSADSRPLPNIHDRESAPFFEAAQEHRLVVRQCQDCLVGIFPPTAHCPRCASWNTPWTEVMGIGRLHTWTTVRDQIHPGFPTPYTLVVVELCDLPDVRMIGHISGEPLLVKDQEMRVWFEHLGDDVVLPQWEIVG